MNDDKILEVEARNLIACDMVKSANYVIRHLLMEPEPSPPPPEPADHTPPQPNNTELHRAPNTESCTDASYEGLGGFSSQFNFKWRLSSSDLHTCGFPVLDEEPVRYAPHPPGRLHMNVLEFLAMFIHSWVSIKLLLTQPAPPGG